MRTFLTIILLGQTLWAPPSRSQDSTRVLIVYHSERGHTAAMAEAVARGARAVAGVTVKLVQATEAKHEDLLAAEAIILGSPVYNASPAPALQHFINQWPFEGNPLRDKVGAAFVTAGGISAGEELAQMSILHAMLIFGMIIVGGPDWRSPFGAAAIVNEGPFDTERQRGEVEAYFLRKGEALGKRVAEAAKRWQKAAKL